MLNKERLKSRRKELNYTQKQMAELIGGTQPNYQQIETRNTVFNKKDTIRKLAEILHTTEDYLTDFDIMPLYQKLTSSDKEKVVKFITELINTDKK